MCLVIVTARLLAWGTLTLIASTTIFASLTTPQWLVGPPVRIGLKSSTSRRNDSTHDFSPINESYSLDGEYYSMSNYYRPTLGIYNRCLRIHGRLNCASFIGRQESSVTERHGDHFPIAWQASLVLFSAGLCLLVLTLLAAIFGWCFRSVGRKSIFSISGSIQALSVLLFILGLVIYPGGWNSSRVQRICGDGADAFFLGDCDLGWAFYVAIAGILLTCIASILSIQAEASTSTNKIQDLILEGKKIICLP